MKELEERHLKEIWNIEADTGNYGEYIRINKQSMEEVAKECANITKEIAVGFSLWQQQGDCRWVLNDEDEWMYDTDYNKRINTEELFTEYLKTLK